MSSVIYEKRERIAYVRLNRPEAKNAINPEAHARLWEVWQDFRDDDALDVAIMTGTDDAICAGAYLKSYMNRWPGVSSQAVCERSTAPSCRRRKNRPSSQFSDRV